MTVLAQYHMGRDEGHLFLVRETDVVPTLIGFSIDALHEEIIPYLSAAIAPSEPDLDPGPGLRALVTPIVDFAESGEHVWIVPHGVLHYLPFHALDTGEGALGFRNPLSYAPSASTLRICRQAPRLGGKYSVVLGDSLEDLKFARREARTVADLFGTDPVLGAAATRGQLLTDLSQDQTFELVHFACHGVPNAIYLAPERRLGVRDADQFTADDILRRRISAALVTVSACEAGFAEMEGASEVLGLTRAFLYSGAASMLMSAWQIDDFSTYLFFQHCYEVLQGMVVEGHGSKALAVQDAQRYVHGLDLTQLVALCDKSAATCGAHGDLSGQISFMQEAAEYAVQALDFDEAVRRYLALLDRLSRLEKPDPDSELGVRERLEELEFRQVLKNRPANYGTQPFSSVSHWGSFFLHGDWRL